MFNINNLSPEEYRWLLEVCQRLKELESKSTAKEQPSDLTAEDFGIGPDVDPDAILDAIIKIGFM